MNKKYFEWLYGNIGSFKKSIIFTLVLNMLAVVFSLVFVENTKIFVKHVERGEKISFWLLFFSLIIIKSCHIFCGQYQNYLRNKTNSLMENFLTLKFFNELLASNVFYNGKLHSGDALNRLTTDVSNISNCLTETIPGLFYSFIQLLVTCVYLTLINPRLTIVIILIMPIAIITSQTYAKKLLPISREIRTIGSKVNQFMQEHIQHHELIVTLEKTSFIWKQLKLLQGVLYEKIITSIKLYSLTNLLTDTAFDISYIVIFTWGVIGIQNKTFSYAELIVFLQLTDKILLPFIQFKSQYPSLIASIASVERLMDIDNLPQENVRTSIMFSVPIGIQFSNVNFRYTETSNWIYQNFNYDFVPCSITAVLGETGAGKTTLLRLFLATLKPNSGNVTFYGTENGTLKSYEASPQTRGNCIYIPQGNSLISGTIRYNMLLGKTDATDDEMRKALYSAAAEFVTDDFPDGLDTLVGEGGVGISEGQAQRIAIARSLLRPGKVILMDEPTSALDIETEKTLLTRLTNQVHDKTIIIVTHKKEICEYVSDVITIKKAM